MQLWTTGVASARGAARTAQEIEAAGWVGRDDREEFLNETFGPTPELIK